MLKQAQKIKSSPSDVFMFSPQVIELEDAVPPSELHLDQALEEQERLDRFNILLFCKPSSNTNT